MIGRGILCAVALGLSACTPEASQGGETAQSAERPVSNSVLLASIQAGMPPGGVTQADLPDPDSLGAELVARYCGLCHGIPQPTTHSGTDWPVVLRRMWLRADHVSDSTGIVAPDAAERVVISRYMVDHALQVGAAALPEGRGRDAFQETCTRCHALPDPRTHAPDDWASVVLRMKGHMEDLLGVTLQQDRIADLVFYLQSASGS